MKRIRSLAWLAMVSLILLIGTGCGGINSSGSISPLDFFLPGLLQNKSKAEQNAHLVSQPLTNTVNQAAQSL